jgi:DNA-binding CsgD family transcriptional regulator
MGLSSSDLGALNQAILEIYSHDDADAFHGALPEIIRGVIPSDYFRVIECKLDTVTGALRQLWYLESDPRLGSGQEQQFRRWAPHHPFIRAAMPTGSLDPVKLTDFCTTRQFRSTPIFSAMYRPFDIGPLMGTSVTVGSKQIMLTVARSLSGHDFSERDRLVLALLRPHIARARCQVVGLRESGVVQRGIARLTIREAEVARWLSRGKSNPEIAAILEMRLRTVEKHVERILAKLGVENRTAATLMLEDRANGPGFAGRPS